MSKKQNRESFNENADFIQKEVTQEYLRDKKLDEIDLRGETRKIKSSKHKNKKTNLKNDQEKAIEWFERNIASCHSAKRIYEERIKVGENIKESRKALAETIKDLQALENGLSGIKKS